MNPWKNICKKVNNLYLGDFSKNLWRIHGLIYVPRVNLGVWKITGEGNPDGIFGGTLLWIPERILWKNPEKVSEENLEGIPREISVGISGKTLTN